MAKTTKTKKGNLSINSENIFPIIKKWLYSDHDIFIRELISNGCDAITKLKKLSMMGEADLGNDEAFKVSVIVNPTEKTIRFIDNGIGMDEEEIEKYINQIAFSGAVDFLNQYKDKAGEDQIIGHFGLGFYSAFMVADKVTIESRSYKEGAQAVGWESDDGMTFKMAPIEKEGRGTIITLYLNEDSVEFANEGSVRDVIEKYCSFMPIEIYLTDETKEPEYEEVPDEDDADVVEVTDAKDDEANAEDSDADGSKADAEEKPKKTKKVLKTPEPINDVTPLWAKHPNECTDDEYKEFYHKVFMDFKEPLFWIHLNMDYPFNLKGILYFPKINTEYDTIEGTIKLYNNRVFIADNIKEVIPDFLMLLKGTIDCPDLPLNVSRSALQNDGFVQKISDYITKKVADKLSGMCKTDRESYEKYWDDISPFIKFGCIRDSKFAEKMKDYLLFKNLDGKYLTLEDCLKENEAEHKNQIFYVTNEKDQGQYIHMFREAKIDAVLLTHNIDTPFISFLEQQNKEVKFIRIDSDLTDSFKDAETDADALSKANETLAALFKKALNNDKLDVKAYALKNPAIASMMTMSEEGRRMQEMMKMYAMYGMDSSMFEQNSLSLILNTNHPLVQKLQSLPEGDLSTKICEQLYDLAMISHAPLEADRMTKFIERSNELMLMLSEK
ncbi:MAG: molecular chaperone HtpG [Lachnospiraceae bacterium]|nr:molecular chaperone HtpG [Lachnospiraceae bacterium]